jgi:hypothetical protein
MSPLDRQIPPSGEEIHIPGGSLQPVLLTVGITMTLLGVTLGAILWITGAVLTIGILAWWIVEAKREYDELPAEHHPAVQETVPREQDRPHGASEQSAAV